MPQLTIPNTFVTGTTIQAAPFNQNFTAVATSVNNVDNTQIGAAGIYASQIIPTTAAQATFGGTTAYTFPTNLTIGPTATTGELFVGSNGSQSLDFGITSATRFTLTGGGLNVASGPIEALAASASVMSYVPPAYTSSGGAVANTLHIAFFALSGVSVSSVEIGSTGVYNYSTTAQTLFTGGSVFTSATSWVGMAFATTPNGGFSFGVIPQTGSTGILAGSGANNNLSTASFIGVAIGT